MTLRRVDRWTIWGAVVAGVLGLPGLVAGQATDSPQYHGGLGLGVFADYPSAFADGGCWPVRPAGLTAFLRRSAGSFLSVEGSGTVTGAGGTACVDALMAIPQDGQIFSRSSLDEHIRGMTFFATNLEAVADPFPARTLGPRFRIGAGRLWDKRLWTWTYGAGVRLRLGEHAIALDVQRWNLGYDLRRELLIFRDSGAHEPQSVEILPQSPRPWLFRLGWERRVG